MERHTTAVPYPNDLHRIRGTSCPACGYELVDAGIMEGTPPSAQLHHQLSPSTSPTTPTQTLIRTGHVNTTNTGTGLVPLTDAASGYRSTLIRFLGPDPVRAGAGVAVGVDRGRPRPQ
eukprot:scaffold46143_cov26-Tisochrysis_lutea.AAC.6